jgi:WD40 repeat protein
VSGSFSPDGETLVTASHDRTAKVWNILRKSLLKTFPHEESVTRVEFSPAGQFFVTADETPALRFWNGTTHEPMGPPIPTDRQAASLVFDARGRRLAVVSQVDPVVRIYRAPTGDLQTELRGHDGFASSAAFDFAGNRVVTTSDDGTARVWNVDGGSEVTRLEGNPVAPTKAWFSADGRYVTVLARDIRYYALESNDLLEVARSRLPDE